MQGAAQKNSLNIDSLPFDHTQINALIEEHGTKGNAQSKNIMRVLKAVKKFYMDTSPACQKERDEWIKPVYIDMMLDDTAAALVKFSKELCGERLMINIQQYCHDAILYRINEMMRTNDKIFQHYHRHDNQLKTALNQLMRI